MPEIEVKDVTNLSKIPRNINSRDRAYRLEYRYKNRFGLGSGKTQEKVFWFHGPLKEATNRVRIHCEKMDYIYIHCSPFIVDLDAQEEMKKENENFNEDY